MSKLKYKDSNGVWQPIAPSQKEFDDFKTSTNSSMAANTSRFKNIWLDVKQDYGAIGDGSSHPLSTKYTTLADAQIKYPCATALTDEIDWCAIQTAINDAKNLASPIDDFGGGIVYLPSGKYLINQTIKMQLYVQLLGFGEGSMTNIKLRDNSNVPMLLDPQTSGNTQYGTNRFGITNICFDGNGVNQTNKITAVTLGYCYIGAYVHNVNIRNVYGTGLVGGADMDIQNLWISYCTDMGWKINAGQLTAKHVFIENCYNDKTIYTGVGDNTKKQATALATGLQLTGGNTTSYDKITILGLHIESCQPAIQMVGSVMDVSIMGISIAPSDGSSNRGIAIDIDSASANYNLYDLGCYGHNALIGQSGTAKVTATYLHYYGDGKSYNNGAIEQKDNAWFRVGRSGPDHSPVDAGTMFWSTSKNAFQFFRGATSGWKYFALPERYSSVNSGATQQLVTFIADEVQPDANYSVIVTPEWNAGNIWVSAKTATNFTISWTTAPGATTNFAWKIVR